jgi:hypothetical protein
MSASKTFRASLIFRSDLFLSIFLAIVVAFLFQNRIYRFLVGHPMLHASTEPEQFIARGIAHLSKIHRIDLRVSAEKPKTFIEE